MVKKLICVADGSVAYLFVYVLRLRFARCIKLYAVCRRTCLQINLNQQVYKACSALVWHTAHHCALCRSGCLAPICTYEAHVYSAA